MNDKYFKDKVVIISGARQGIGRTLSEMLAAAGSKLVINSRNTEKLSELKSSLSEKGCDITEVPGDISDGAVCKGIADTAVQKFGRIDILINNAGIAGAGTVELAESVVFKKQIDVNLMGSYYMTKWALPHIIASHGSILFVSSLAALYGLPSYSGYSASKMAITALAQSLKSELHGKNVHVGVAYVGFTENDPAKEQYNLKGELVPLPDRKIRRVTSGRTASLLLRQICRRKFRSVHSALGKAESVFSKFFPGLIEVILRNAGAKETSGR
jgi:short-subunit dehydrogenase